MAYVTPGWTPKRIIKSTTEVYDEGAERIERRRYPRVKAELPGRFMTPGGDEYDCVTVDLSPGGVRFQASMSPSVGVNIIAYVRELGRLQGNVVRRMRDGFAIEIVATPLKTERLRQKIAWLRPEGVADRRLFPRVTVPGAMIPVRCADGRNQIAPIIDVSESGIAFRIGLALTIGDRVEIGEQTGVIVRLFDGGAAAKFT